MSEDREPSDPGPDPPPDLAADGDATAADGVDDDAPSTDAGDADGSPSDATRSDPADGSGGSSAAADERSPTDGSDERLTADSSDSRPDDGDTSAPSDAAAGPDAAPVTDGATVGDVGVDPAAGDGHATVDHAGPEEDVEMPLADHIEEMIRRLGLVFLVGGVVMLVVFPAADGLINYLWNTHIPGAATIADRRPRLYGPLELLLTELKVAALAGLIAGVPVLVYQSYRFMRPGLYPNERRYYLAAVPTSLVLAFVGVAFAHFVVLPAIFAYFTSYTTGTALVAFGLRETFNLILLLMGYMAVVFQIPLFIMLGIMMGLVTRRWLEDKRLLFWGAFLGISFLVSPDPTGMAPIIVTVTMITLFEGTLALLRWTGN
jgi:sec-independent protein translocase protein TatC